ncbi:glycosyltransferase [Microcella humidisoli]|uniref:4,4'-diaponeurosporenoate glycosyltransferase n=1 Tax=Microcella humidisoli TaxID=2963406 RepID=A0ABY5FZ53_9MICO|nr:glycosyltransferase family A protein [Microcella humidisoli]UTT63609.1 glycosyltransferase family 2 protein [Microcella humidisoli]
MSARRRDPHVGIVVPARDERDLIGRCLDSIIVAAAQVDARVSIVVVADSCRDGTAQAARAAAQRARASRNCELVVLEIDAENVGIARSVGCRQAIAAGCSWLALTDADSVVPENWVGEHVQMQHAGFDVVIGTVRPDFDDLSAAHVRQWLETHEPGRPNGHVHGANLGVRASAYLTAGGFAPLAEHEDNELVARLVASGATVVATDRAEVMTSGRTLGRTAGGYAGHLRGIAESLERDARSLRG